MSKFATLITKIENVIPHPNADRLDLAVIGGYHVVIKKKEFGVGDLALYIPTDSVIPDNVAYALKIKSYLVGKAKNRVKALRLRGEMSQGILVSIFIVKDCLSQLNINILSFSEGQDLTETLGITKYEEPVPVEMAGHVRPWPSYLDHYDIENVNHPDHISIFNSGEMVYVTEKLHGTNMAISIGPGLDYPTEQVFVCSRRTALKDSENNLYWNAVRKYSLTEKLSKIYDLIAGHNHVLTDSNMEVTIRGEVIGIQDLKYGYTNENPGFYAFDIRVNGSYLDYESFVSLCDEYEIPHVPLLYYGPYDYDKIKLMAQGKSNLDSQTILEGVVVKPAIERWNQTIGRVVLKFISEEYELRSEGTELH